MNPPTLAELGANRLVFSGATSETGLRVATQLAARFGAANIVCLVRPSSQVGTLQRIGVTLETGDVTDGHTLGRLLDEKALYLDMTHPKFYPQSLDTIRKSGLKRAVFVTTTGIFSRYHHCSDIYRDGEERLRACGFSMTILRPSMIYGSPRDKNMNRLVRTLHRFPMFPLFGAGRSLMQPVFVDDLAQGIVSAVGNPNSVGRAYNLAGPVGISYRGIVETILKKLERRVTLLNVGLPLAAGLVGAAQYVPGFPLKREQVLRLLEDKVFDISSAQDELHFWPRSFAEGIEAEIEAMRAEGTL